MSTHTYQKYMSRPARLQVDPEQISDDDKPPQTGHTFNIWYLKWAGGDSNTRNVVQSKFRVNIKDDSGSTKGTDGKSPICVFFAQGCCYKGKECPYLHRLPRAGDVRIPTQDCFGRDKTAEYKDDMSGVGSLSRTNVTLYVGGIHMNDQIQDTLSEQFSEFGEIDKIKVMPSKGCAFVSFRFEAQAQFAKEAMDSQTLDGKDVLTVRWANDDPDPNAQEDAKRTMEQMAMDTVKSLLGDVSKNTGNAKRQKTQHKKQPEPESPPPQEVAKSDTEAPSGEPESFFDNSRLRALKKLASKKPRPAPAGPQEPAKIEPATEPTKNEPPNKEHTFLSGYSSDSE